ncbi:MAG: hypothetical protein PHF79_01140 [Candidatus Pacebacteria bacterium]|nr:hypothetical protein [Candidatus Paceibacterota bacterium]
MDSYRMKLKDYLKNIPDLDIEIGIEKLIEEGTIIAAHTDMALANQHGKINLFYYHDVRKMYIKWRTASRKLLEKNKEIAKEEEEIFLETDSISSRPLLIENPDFPNAIGDQELANINKEVREKLKVLRPLRNKVSKENLNKRKTSFDDVKSILTLRGDDILISKSLNSDAHDLLRTLFKDRFRLWENTDILEDWQFSLNIKLVPKNKVYQAGKSVNRIIAGETRIKDFILTSTKTTSINKGYL